MMERVRLTTDSFWVKDSAGVKTFDSSYKYLKISATGDLKVGGIPKTPMVEMVNNVPFTSNTGFPADVSILGDSYTITLPPCNELFSANHLGGYYFVDNLEPKATLPGEVEYEVTEILEYEMDTPFQVDLNGVYVGDLKIENITAHVTGDATDIYGTWGYKITLPDMTFSNSSDNVITFNLPTENSHDPFTWTRTFIYNRFNYGYTPPVGATGRGSWPVRHTGYGHLLSPVWCCAGDPNTLTFKVT